MTCFDSRVIENLHMGVSPRAGRWSSRYRQHDGAVGHGQTQNPSSVNQEFETHHGLVIRAVPPPRSVTGGPWAEA